MSFWRSPQTPKEWEKAIPPVLVPWNRGCVAMVQTGVKPLSHAAGTPCILHNLSMSISIAILDMHQPIGCGTRHKLPGLHKPPRILLILNCPTVTMLMRMLSLLGLSFLH